ncbi:MAG: hypothetical protein WBA67_08055 [Jannaschia sp.]
MNALLKHTPFWQPDAQERLALLRHLLAELPAGHVLWTHRETLAVEARDGDRLIVRSADPAYPVSVVHMSWAGRPAMAPFLPETETYPTDAALLDALTKARA